MDSATNVNQATGTAATIQTGDVVTGTTGSADKLTITGAVGSSGTFYTLAAGVTGFEQLVLDNTSNFVNMPTAIVASATAGSYNVITGGTGFDTIAMNNAAGTGATNATAGQVINFTTVTGVDQFNFGANTQFVNTTGAAATGLFNTLAFTAPTLTMGNFLNNITLTNSAAAVVVVNGGTSNDTVTLANTAAATSVTFNGVETVNAANSGVLDVVIFGGATAVNFTAGSAGSNVQGSTASDTITLKTTGTGVETIVLNQTATADTINNFKAAGADKLSLSKAVYNALAGNAGDATLGGDFTSVAGVTTGTDTSATAIVFDSTNGNVYYNADGATAGGLSLIATLTGFTTLAAGDFNIIA